MNSGTIHDVAARAAADLAAIRAKQNQIQAAEIRRKREEAIQKEHARQQREAERERKRIQNAAIITQQQEAEKAFGRSSKARKKAERAELKARTDREAAGMLERIASGQPRPKIAVDIASRRVIQFVTSKVVRTGEVVRVGKYRAG